MKVKVIVFIEWSITLQCKESEFQTKGDVQEMRFVWRDSEFEVALGRSFVGLVVLGRDSAHKDC